MKIDSTIKKDAEIEEENQEHEERSDEVHEDNDSQKEQVAEEVQPEPYDPNDIWELEVNNKHKARNIKNLLLEKLKLPKKTNILLYRKNPNP